MEAIGLMLGNIVACRDNHQPGIVIAIEERMVHLEKGGVPNNEQDIECVPLTDWINWQTNGLKKGIIMIVTKGMSLGFNVKRSQAKAILTFSLHQYSPTIILSHIHQLQNLVFILTGQQLDLNRKWD